MNKNFVCKYCTNKKNQTIGMEGWYMVICTVNEKQIIDHLEEENENCPLKTRKE